MKVVFAAGLLLSMGSAAYAIPCTNGTLQSYLNLGAGGCDLGAATFSGFQIVPGQTGATVIGAGNVLITPGGSVFNPMFTFGLTNPTVTAAQLLESIFRFRVSASLLTGASLQLAGSATGDGLIANVLNVCPNGSFAGNTPGLCPNIPDVAVTFLTATDRELTSSTGPLRASFFDVFFDLALDGGSRGTATLSSATLAITATPEPSAGLLLAAGLAALAGLKARRS